MKRNYSTPFQLMETASQIKEAVEDRVLSEEEIEFFFENLDKCITTYEIHHGDIFQSFLYFFVRAENQSVQIDTSTNNSGYSHPSAIIARKTQKKLDVKILQPFRTTMHSFTENAQTLNVMDKEHLKRLTDIVITKIKKYADKSLQILFP